MFDEIAVLYPRGQQTGGPEALHQLVDSLRRVGHDAYLVATAATADETPVSAYSTYDAPERTSLPTSTGTAVVVPETAVLSENHGGSVVFRWWLSVDNASTERWPILRLEHGLGIRGEWAEMPRHHRVGTAFRTALTELAAPREVRPEVALAQSQYAWAHVFATTRRPPTVVADYTPNPDELVAASVPTDRRKRVVCFNPKKSGDLARELAVSMADVDFMPIENMSRQQVVETLGESAVYLDLGSHPGKDRIPREAALAGAVVVVAMRGSAAFHADVPLPLEHKVPFDENVVASARDSVAAVLADLEHASALQDPYRAVISREKTVFDAQVRAVFTYGQRGFDADYPVVEAVDRLSRR